MIKFDIELEPFRTPNYATVKQKAKPRQDGVNFEAPKYHVSELDADTLGTLCDQFRRDVFAKAGLEEE